MSELTKLGDLLGLDDGTLRASEAAFEGRLTAFNGTRRQGMRLGADRGGEDRAMGGTEIRSGPEGPWGSAEALEVESAAGELARRLADRLDLDVDVVVTAKRGNDEISIAMSAVPSGTQRVATELPATS